MGHMGSLKSAPFYLADPVVALLDWVNSKYNFQSSIFPIVPQSPHSHLLILQCLDFFTIIFPTTVRKEMMPARMATRATRMCSHPWSYSEGSRSGSSASDWLSKSETKFG